jgi:hypothetical protein
MRAKALQKRAIAAALAAAIPASCADIPRDPERTEALVRESGTIRLAVVTGTPPHPAADKALRRIAEATGAGIEQREGDSEAALTALEEGRIDLVYGTFALASPWAKHVHFGRAITHRAEPPKHVAAPRFAYRNGENGWIMEVEAAVAQP